MKLSNKLLIGFATACTIIPLLGMVFESQVNYKKGTYSDRGAIQVDTVFRSPSTSMTAKELSAFNQVAIDEGQAMSLDVSVVKDPNYGIKIDNRVKDQVDATVDQNGKLTIQLKDGSERRYVRIIIFGPNVKQLRVINAGMLTLHATGDSLRVEASGINQIRFNSSLSLASLGLTTKYVKRIDAYRLNLPTLHLAMSESNFSSSESSFGQLAIETAGKSEIEMYDGRSNNSKVNSVDHLQLVTKGEARLRLSDIKINRYSGSLSDETLILEAPAAMLNQMYRK